MPPRTGCERTRKELEEGDSVTPLAGRRIVSGLCLSDVKDPAKNL